MHAGVTAVMQSCLRVCSARMHVAEQVQVLRQGGFAWRRVRTLTAVLPPNVASRGAAWMRGNAM
jgi:hypothetical protein